MKAQQSSQVRLKGTNDRVWSALLDKAASTTSRELPTRTIILLGDSDLAQDLVNEFRAAQQRGIGKSRRTQVIPCTFRAIPSSTYIDLEDDQEEVLLRLRFLYLPLTDGFEGVYNSLITASQVAHTSFCILLDWRIPWSFLQQLSKSIKFIRNLVNNLKQSDQDYETAFIDAVSQIRVNLQKCSAQILEPTDTVNRVLPILDAECYKQPIGFMTTVVAVNTEHQSQLMENRQYRDVQFDFIQQSLRSALLSLGGSLQYISSSSNATVDRLLSSLIYQVAPDVLKELGHTDRDSCISAVIENDKVHIPAGWDTVKKIDFLREEFDAIGAYKRWQEDLANQGLSPQDGGYICKFEEVLRKKQPVDFISGSIPKPEHVPFRTQEEYLRSLREQIVTTTDDLHSGAPTTIESTVFTADPRLEYSRNRDMMAMPSSPSKMAKSGREKDEFVQAFFQNLLTRTRED